MDHAQLKQRFLRIENDFLAAVAHGETAIGAFQDTWATLLDDFDQALRSHSLDDNTIVLAHEIASSIAALASGFLNLHEQSTTISSALTNELEDIFSHITFTDTRQANSLGREGTIPPVDISRSPLYSNPCLPPYIAPAYKWLLKNIHNPYPSKSTKLSFAEETGSTIPHIDTWFVQVRRRTGWTSLVRKWYKGSRSDALDAAYRALVDDDPIRPLDANLRMEFIQVEANARELYAHKLVKSSLAGQMNRAVRDMTDIDRRRREELKALEAEEKRERLHKQKEMAKIQKAEERAIQRMKRVRAKSSYPSPDRSFSAPLTSDATDESDDELQRHPPIWSSRQQKRRASPDSDCDGNTHSAKRPRIDSKSPEKDPIPEFVTGLPSPAPETSPEISATSPLHEAEALSTPSPSPSVPIINRKRRLSEGSTQGAPKRPRGLLVGPRLQAVSDPLPKSNALDFQTALEFDGWLKQINFDIPSPVSFEQLDPLAPLEIELFDYSSFSESFNDPPIQYHLDSVTTSRPSPSPKTTTSNPPEQQSPSRPLGVLSSDPANLLTGSEPLEGPLDVELFQNWLSSPDFEQPAPNFTEFIDFSWDANDVFDLSSASSSDPTTFSYAISQLPKADSTTSESALAWFHHLSSSTHSDFSNTSLTISPPTLKASPSPLNDVTDEVSKREQEKVAKQKQLLELQEAARLLEAELSQP